MMSLNENQYSNLQGLRGSDFEIKDGQPEVIGWEVYDAEENEIGEVQDVLFDPETYSVRYLVVDLESNDLEIEEKSVLIPIGVAEFHQKEDEVILPGITVEQLSALPEYEKGKVNSEMEMSIRNVFEVVSGTGVVAAAAYHPAEFYAHDHFNENKFNSRKTLPVIEEDLTIGKDEVETGGTRITSRIVETPVEEKVNLKEEHVYINRVPVNRAVQDADYAFKEEEFEITEHAEVPFVTKEARVVEEVTVSKDVEEREETIRETLSSTEVEAEQVKADLDKKQREGWLEE